VKNPAIISSMTQVIPFDIGLELIDAVINYYDH